MENVSKPLSSDTPKSISENRRLSPTAIVISVVILLVIFTGVYLLVRQVSPTGNLSAVPTPTPTPTASPRKVPHGKIDFAISQSDKTVPQLGKGSIDPIDVAQGGTQTVIVAVKNAQPVTGVTAILKTDHQISSPVALSLISGTATDGQWQGSWTVNDTYTYLYHLKLDAASTNGTGSFELTLR